MEDKRTVTRMYLAEAVFKKMGYSMSESGELVDEVLEEVIRAMEKGEQIKLSSFGAFKIRQKNERMGRNPKTKKEVPISPRRVVSFHASNLLTDRMNKKEPR